MPIYSHEPKLQGRKPFVFFKGTLADAKNTKLETISDAFANVGTFGKPNAEYAQWIKRNIMYELELLQKLSHRKKVEESWFDPTTRHFLIGGIPLRAKISVTKNTAQRILQEPVQGKNPIQV